MAELLAAAGDGDRSGWEELVNRYAGLVRATAASFRLQDSDTADVVQNTWLRLLGSHAAIRDPKRLGGWLVTTARREALAVIRRSSREVAIDHLGDGQLAAPDSTPESEIIDAERRAAVRTVVSRLSGRRRLLVHAMFYQPPCSYADLSSRTGLPVGSIGPTRQRALGELHRRLHEQDRPAPR